MPRTDRIKSQRTHTPCPLPDKWVPLFWQETDHRFAVSKEIRRRVDVLTQDTGADSEQKRLLISRAVWITLQLETAEVQAATTGRFDPGTYSNLSNCLLGILKALGLEKKARAGTLKDYIESGTNGDREGSPP